MGTSNGNASHEGPYLRQISLSPEEGGVWRTELVGLFSSFIFGVSISVGAR